MLSIPKKFTVDVAIETNKVIHRKNTKEGLQSSFLVLSKNSVGLAICFNSVLNMPNPIFSHHLLFQFFIIKKK